MSLSLQCRGLSELLTFSANLTLVSKLSVPSSRRAKFWILINTEDLDVKNSFHTA